jgi:hypothetical protein
VTEGEKAADAAAETGRHAIGTVCGAPSDPGPAAIAFLARYAVTLAPDNDPVGRRHMAAIATALERAGVPAVRWIDPPADAPDGWDLADAAPDARLALIDGARPLFGFGTFREWQPEAGDPLYACTFGRAGFRSFALRAPDGAWRLVLSRVDVGEREPRAILTAEAPGHPGAFGDLDGHVLARSVGLFGGANLAAVTKALEARIGTRAEDWARRLDYLVARTLREVQGSGAETMAIDGEVSRPAGGAYVFEGRLRAGRTASLYGPGSAGKTTIADGLVVSAISGVTIIPGWLPTRRFRVGVLDWDEGREEELVRLYAITAGHGVPELTGYRYRRMGRPLPEAADDVGRWVTGEGIELLIVTPVNRAIRQTDRDPSGPVHELYEVLREFGTSNLLIDHVTGANIDKPDATREYGSVAKRDNARGSFSLFEQSQEPGSRVVVIRNAKPDALTPRQSAQAVRITFDPPWPNADGSYDRIRFDAAEVVDDRTAPAAPHEAQPDKMARLLREHGPMDAVRLCVVSGFAAARLRDIARRTREAGYHVHFDADAGQYVLDMPPEDAE